MKKKDCLVDEALISKLTVSLRENAIKLTTMNVATVDFKTRVVNNLEVLDKDSKTIIPVAYTKTSAKWFA